MDGWFCVCVCVSACACACVHPYLYVYKHAWMSVHVLSASVFVCVNIWMYLCISAVQWSCISRLWHFQFEKPDGYLAAHFVFNIWYWSTGSCQLLHLNRQQCTSHRCACPLTLYTRRCCHISQSASSHDTENVIYRCWCLKRHSTLPYDNMAT